MNRKGQTLVEFVLILPILIFILFSVFDFGMILNKKNELENSSVDIANMIRNNESIDKIRNNYPDITIDIHEDDKYTVITLSTLVDIMTPGLNLVLGDPYKVEVERTIYHATK